MAPLVAPVLDPPAPQNRSVMVRVIAPGPFPSGTGTAVTGAIREWPEGVAHPVARRWPGGVPAVPWLVVCLWCPRDVAQQRIAARRTGDDYPPLAVVRSRVYVGPRHPSTNPRHPRSHAISEA